MKKILVPILVLTLFGCTKEFEPKLTGLMATQDLYKNIIYLDSNQYNEKIEFQKPDNVGYSNLQLTRERDGFLLTLTSRGQKCPDYRVGKIDFKGTILDTIFTAPPGTTLDFKSSPNDSLLLLKTYDKSCSDKGQDFMFTFFDIKNNKVLHDTIKISNGINIMLSENSWSPDSKKLIISEWYGRTEKAFTYDLVTKDTAVIGTGTNFMWSPTDNELIAYIKDYSVFTRNIRTGEVSLIYKGRRKNEATHLWWDPKGEFLMINLTQYYLNFESKMTWQPTCFYLRISDRAESEKHSYNSMVDTWR